MSNVYSPEAQASINTAENKLGDAIKNLKSQISNNEPTVEAIVEHAPDVDVVIDAPQSKEPVKEPRRSEFVQTDDPKVMERINDLYGQAKKSDARNQMMAEHNLAMERALLEAKEEINRIKQTTQDAASNKVELELKAALRTAREDNDFDTMESIEDKLLDLRMEKRLADKIPQQEQKVAPKIDPQQQQFEAQYLRNAAYLEVIGQEKDAKGNPVRAYLYNGHPDNAKAIGLFESIPKEFAAAGRHADIKTIMDVLDERMRGKKNNPQSSVLGSDDHDAPSKTTVRLTQAEINTARNMGITPERYARQKQLING